MPSDLLPQMLAAQAERGPDDVGFLHGPSKDGTPQTAQVNRSWPGASQWEGVGLGHLRLAIIDTSERGWQPMRRGRYAMVYNGEVYNYRELREELASLGEAFTTESDTEVILAAFSQWGPAAFGRFVGMFALAIFDERDGSVTLARDPFGIKPLYVTRVHGATAFASTLPALLTVPGVSRAADLQSVRDYLESDHGITGHGTRTMFAAIEQFPAGHWQRLDFQGVAGPVAKYEHVTAPTSSEPPAVQFRRSFLESVRLHMRSDVRVGAALSGGLDSAAIVCAMRAALGDEGTIDTFTYRPEDPALDEWKWAQLVNEAAGADGHEVRLTPQEAVNSLNALVRAQGEPFGSTSILAQFAVFEAAKKQGVIVMLDGQGADEMLGGYDSYRYAYVAQLLLQGKWRTARRVARASGPDAWTKSLAWLLPAGLRHRLQRQNRPPVLQLVKWDWLQTRGARSRPTAIHPPSLKGELRETLERTSLPSLLRYEDRNSMAHSIESRVPFLTQQLVTSCLSFPDEALITADGTRKAPLREAMQGLVPARILERKDKIGFETGERRLLQNMHGAVASLHLPFVDAAAFDPPGDDASPRDVRARWRLWNLALWANTFQVVFDSNEDTF